MPPGGFGPDPRYGFPIIPTAPYAAAAMMPSGTSIAAQKLVSWIVVLVVYCWLSAYPNLPFLDSRAHNFSFPLHLIVL